MSPDLHALRVQCGQQDDLTTDPEYFIAANALGEKRSAAVLIWRDGRLEACVLFFEYCKFGVGLGLFRGGDKAGDGLVIGIEDCRLQYVHLATQALFRRLRVYGVRVTVKANLEKCLRLMGPATQHQVFSEQQVSHTLPLAPTYQQMLAGLGSRTRRSLAGKRQQLENRTGVVFVPSLAPDKALEAMLSLQPRSLPDRISGFYHARYSLVCGNPDFFCMGLRLPEGEWLSILSGWRRNRITYIDLQMNDMHLKKESVSAVMRAFMLEHEIARAQQMVNFVGGTSLLLRRYCRPAQLCTYAYLSRPGLRARLFNAVMRRIQPEDFDKLVRPYDEEQLINGTAITGLNEG